MLTTRPFVPFRIVLSNQREYDIRNPQMVMVTPFTTHIGIVRTVPLDSPLYDAVDIVSNEHISVLEPIIPRSNLTREQLS
jgi:hypothetical protein